MLLHEALDLLLALALLPLSPLAQMSIHRVLKAGLCVVTAGSAGD
ncbi:MAG TPA: hypothetical protein VG325_08085 [Solirubrobacteraceae bacterium]|nr:hypothetical protein [Solirubrobacteraceae bacterium]